MDASIDEIAFLAQSEHRTAVLDELARRPCDRAELRAATGASPPTLSRILSDFQGRRWIERSGPTYALSPIGAFVVDRFAELRRAMETGQRLRDVVPWLPREMEGFAVELFADATVSFPGPGYPSEPIERVLQLVEGAERMRGFGYVTLKANALETVCRAIIGGMEFEFVYPPAAIDTLFSWNPALSLEASACANCTEFVHDGLPDVDWCGLCLYDERVAICCNDVGTGVLAAVVDTDSPAAFEWAEAVYDQYRGEATRLDVEQLTATG